MERPAGPQGTAGIPSQSHSPATWSHRATSFTLSPLTLKCRDWVENYHSVRSPRVDREPGADSEHSDESSLGTGELHWELHFCLTPVHYVTCVDKPLGLSTYLLPRLSMVFKSPSSMQPSLTTPNLLHQPLLQPPVP